MPGAITHLIVQRRMNEYLWGEGANDHANLLDQHRCDPYPAFGSMGPDFLFFSLKEYGTPLDEFTNKLFDVYDAFQPFVDFYEEKIEPVEHRLERIVRTVDKAVLRGILQDLRQTTGTMSAALKTKVEALVSQQVDPFYFYTPNLQKGVPENEWYWFDVLHSRRTGDFGSRLWHLANNAGDKDLQRYALGYASHIAADTVGHPFVNAVAGGPWRTHWHRHKLIENWIDAYARDHYRDVGIENCITLEPGETYTADSISGSHHYELVKFHNGKLPDKLAELFSRAMRDTYGTMGQHPPFLNPSDLDSAYRLWLTWFEKATTRGDAAKPDPVNPPGSKAAKLINDYIKGFPAPPKSGSMPSGGGVGNVLGGLLEFVDWLTDAIDHTFSWLFNNLDDIFTLPYYEALQTLKWFLYQIHKMAWEVYDNSRFTLVLAGYVYPEPRDLNKNPWGNAFINTAFAHQPSGGQPRFSRYPLQEEAHNIAGPINHHLRYPQTPQEEPKTESAPKAFYGANPEVFISGQHAYNPQVEKLYDCVRPYGNTDQATNHVNSQTWNGAQFGSAVEFSARLIAQRMDQIPNFNLSGDRGYAWKTWRTEDTDVLVADHRGTAHRPVEVSYIDVR